MCVPSSVKGTDAGANGTSTGSSGIDFSVPSRGTDTETSDGGNTSWVEVIGKGNKKRIKWDSATAERVARTDQKARRSTSRRGQR